MSTVNTGPRQTGPVSNPKHRITNADAEKKLGDCSVCGQQVAVFLYGKGVYWRCKAFDNAYRFAKRQGTYRSPRHTVTNADATLRMGDCVICGPKILIARGGSGMRYWLCSQNVGASRSPYRVAKKSACEWCGYSVHRAALDVDHLNEQHDDNRLENLKTICSNDHRIKTWLVRNRQTADVWRTYGAPEWAIPQWAKVTPPSSQTAL